MSELYPANPQVTGRSAQQIANFCKAISERDYVLACDGTKVLAIGRVRGPYAFDDSHGFPHFRPVEWLDIGEWQLPMTEGLQTTVHEYKNHTDNLVAIEKRVLDAPSININWGPSWLQPTVLLNGRLAKFGAQLEFL